MYIFLKKSVFRTFKTNKTDFVNKIKQEAQEGLYRSTGLYSFMAANTELSTLTV